MNKMVTVCLLNNRSTPPWRDSLFSMRSVGATLSVPALVSQPLESELRPFQNLDGGNVYPFSHLPLSPHQKKRPGSSEWSDWQEGKASPSFCLRRGLPGTLTSQAALGAAASPAGRCLTSAALTPCAHRCLGMMDGEMDSGSLWP